MERCLVEDFTYLEDEDGEIAPPNHNNAFERLPRAVRANDREFYETTDGFLVYLPREAVEKMLYLMDLIREEHQEELRQQELERLTYEALIEEEMRRGY